MHYPFLVPFKKAPFGQPDYFVMEVKKKSINWNRSAVESGVAWLVDQSKRKEFIDLSHLWIITQTSGASRRLTDALTQYANERDNDAVD